MLHVDASTTCSFSALTCAVLHENRRHQHTIEIYIYLLAR
jgi:hypothetical protein